MPNRRFEPDSGIVGDIGDRRPEADIVMVRNEPEADTLITDVDRGQSNPCCSEAISSIRIETDNSTSARALRARRTCGTGERAEIMFDKAGAMERGVSQ